MARNGGLPNLEDLDLSESDTDALFASPSHPPSKSRQKPTKPDPQQADAPQSRKADVADDAEEDGEEAREAALRKELAGIRTINQTIEGAIDSLERARGNMDTVSNTVRDASTLLNTWTRILSQTEHNQRVILDPSWHGASQDLVDVENETALKQQEKERRDLEEAQKREARARKAEEDELKRAENARSTSSRGGRMRGRGASRGLGSSRAPVQAASGTTARDTGSKVARAGNAGSRGTGSYRGRSRGT
ncbi:MAG: hypothetical protein Q9174_004270 [Haloplaca sp. 1 TL-2023]